MAPMKYEATKELLDAVRSSLDREPLTWDEVKGRGGPSSTTMTNLTGGTLGSIARSTLRKLGDALGWPDGVEIELVSADLGERQLALARVRASEPKRGARTRGEDSVGSRADVIFNSWARHAIAALGLELEYADLRGVDQEAARAELWDALSMAQQAGKGERAFIPAWRETEAMEEAQAWVDEYGLPDDLDVSADRYDLAAHEDPAGYVRDYDREAPSDEGA